MANELTLQQQQEKDEAIATIKRNISLDNNAITNYGSQISGKLSDFSSDILKTVKVKDAPEVDDLLLSLMGKLNSIDCNSLQQKKPNFLQRLMGKTDPQTFIARYETVDAFIGGVSKKLEQAEFSLGKDIEMYEKFLEQNRQYIAELDLYIEAGRQYIAEAKNQYEEMRSQIDESDLLAVNELATLESQIRQFENKVHTMDVQRTVAIQNIPQIQLLKEGDAVLVEKINASIKTSIPLWQSQMVIAIGILRQENGTKLVKSVADTNNELLRKNSELLKTSSVAVAKELERDIVDLDTLRNTNEQLISTIREIREIRENGQKEREAVTLELANMQKQLIEATMSSGISTADVPGIEKGIHPTRFKITAGGN